MKACVQMFQYFITSHSSAPLHWSASCRGRPWWNQRWPRTEAPGCWPPWRSCLLSSTPWLRTPRRLCGQTENIWHCQLQIINVKVCQRETLCDATWQNQNQAHGKEIRVRSQTIGIDGYIFFKEIQYVATDEIIKGSTPGYSNAGCSWEVDVRKISDMIISHNFTS